MGCVNEKEVAKRRKHIPIEGGDNESAKSLIQTERVDTDFIFHNLDPLSSNSDSKLAQRQYIKKGVSKMNSQTRLIKQFECSSISNRMKEELHNSITKLTKLKHLNVQGTVSYYYHDNRVFVVGEYYDGGNLLTQLDKFSKLSQHAMMNIFCQIIAGVQYLHENDIIHGDIRLEHIIFTNKTMEKIKLIDFGISNELKTACQKWKTNNTISEFSFYSPEALKDAVTSKSDMWACGCLLYFLLTSHMPFQGKNVKSLQNAIKRGIANFDATEWVNINPQLKDLVSKMLSPNPRSRPSASQILNNSALSNRYNIVSKPNKQLQKHMEEFKIYSQLQTAVLIYIAENMMSESDKNKLMDEFGKFDLNKDGFLTKDELIQAYSLTMSKEKALQQVNNIFRKVDSNNSGKIDYQGISINQIEFILATIDQKKYFNKEKLLLLFSQVDRDHSGRLSKMEVKKMLRDMQIPKHKYDQLCNELDCNGDGEITQDEFVNMMLTI